MSRPAVLVVLASPIALRRGATRSPSPPPRPSGSGWTAWAPPTWPGGRCGSATRRAGCAWSISGPAGASRAGSSCRCSSGSRASTVRRASRCTAISFDDERPSLDAFLKEVPVSFPILWDRAGDTLGDRLAIRRLPTTWVVDRAGVVRSVHVGFDAAEGEKLAPRGQAPAGGAALTPSRAVRARQDLEPHPLPLALHLARLGGRLAQPVGHLVRLPGVGLAVHEDAPLAHRLGGLEQRHAGEVAHQRLEAPLPLRVDEGEGVPGRVGGVVVRGPVHHPAEAEPDRHPGQHPAGLAREPEARHVLPGQPRAPLAELRARVAQREPVHVEHLDRHHPPALDHQLHQQVLDPRPPPRGPGPARPCRSGRRRPGTDGSPCARAARARRSGRARAPCRRRCRSRAGGAGAGGAGRAPPRGPRW